ncbi:MAG: NfeD family protein, partial [Vibrio sp.]
MPYLTHILFVVGLIFIALEVTVLGFSSLILFFVGLAFIATSLLFWTGIFAPSLVVALSLSIAFT